MVSLMAMFGVHRYLYQPFDPLAVGVPPSIALSPKQYPLLIPAFSFGNGFTVTKTVSELWHPFASVANIIYVVVEDGLVFGFAILDLLTPEVGFQA